MAKRPVEVIGYCTVCGTKTSLEFRDVVPTHSLPHSTVRCPGSQQKTYAVERPKKTA